MGIVLMLFLSAIFSSCAFVDFHMNDKENADTLINQLNKKEVKGRKLNVRHATPDGHKKSYGMCLM